MTKVLPTKTFVLVMILFILVVLILTSFFYYQYNPDIFSKTNQKTYSLPVTSEPTSLVLNLSSPDDNILTFTPDILIQGKTSPGSVILLSGNASDEIINTQKKGDFSLTFKLKSGLNELKIIAFDSSGNSKTEARTIYYSPEKI